MNWNATKWISSILLNIFQNFNRKRSIPPGILGESRYVAMLKSDVVHLINQNLDLQYVIAHPLVLQDVDI